MISEEDMPDGKSKNTDELLNDLKSANVHLQKRAFEALKHLEDDAEIAKVVNMLEDQSWHFRSKLVDILGDIGSPAVAPLIRSARTGVWYVRAGAAAALGRTGNLRSIGILIQLLNDKTAAVRKPALAALSNIASFENAFQYAGELKNLEPELRDRILKHIESRDEMLHDFLLRILSGEEKPPEKSARKSDRKAGGEMDSFDRDKIMQKFRSVLTRMSEAATQEQVQ
jgi:HEAT repeat protein